MRPLQSFVSVALLVLLCACSDEAPPAQAPAVVTPAPPQPPAPLPAPLVKAKQFEDLLPAAIGEWTRIELRSTEFETGEGRMLQSDAAYQIGAQLPLIHVSLLDTRGGKAMQSTFQVMREHPNVGGSSFSVADQPAVEQYATRPLYTTLMVLAGDRHLLTINAEGSTRETARKILDAIDIKALAQVR